MKNFKVLKTPSPNFSSRGKSEIQGIILHYTGGGSAAGTTRWFSKQESRVSAHIVIGRDGIRYECVDIDKAAWHAGAAHMHYGSRIRSDINKFTIGVEFANYGLLHSNFGGDLFRKRGGDLVPYIPRPNQSKECVSETMCLRNTSVIKGFWEPYTDAQIDSFVEWLYLLDEKYCFAKNPKSNIYHRMYGHSDICVPVGRKIDPGPLFPWKEVDKKIESLLGEKQRISRCYN